MIACALVVNAHEYAYVNMPKAACTSIKMAIAEQIGMPFEQLPHNRRICRPATELAYRNNLFRWTVVRHPADRLVSCWTETQPPQTDKILQYNCSLRRKQGMTFPEFVRAVAAERDTTQNAHYAVQWHLLAPHGTCLVDAMFRFDKLAANWAAVQTLTGLGPLGHYRKSEHEPWRTYYDDELRAIVERRYAADFENLGFGW